MACGKVSTLCCVSVSNGETLDVGDTFARRQRGMRPMGRGKGELTENVLPNKAATLAAKKHALLSQPHLPASLVNAKTKPTSRELTKLTKQLRQFPGGMGAPRGLLGDDEEREVEEEGDLVMGPMEQWLKRMIKGTPPATKPHTTTTGSVKKKGQPSTSGSKIPVPKS